jgi:hypothetical protein
MATSDLPQLPKGNAICPACGKSIIVYNNLASNYLACSNCNGYLALTNENSYKLKNKIGHLIYQQVLEIGATGMLDGYEFTVVAYLEKKEKLTQYQWVEYLLYHPRGYATLAEFDGHWSLIRGTEFFPDLAEIALLSQIFVKYKGSEYRLFNKYSPAVTGAVGQFEEDILDSKINAREFVNAPFMIVREQQGNKTSHYLGEHIESKTIARAFNVDHKLFPKKSGIGALQPSKYADRWNSLFTITGIAIILVLVLHLLIGYIKPQFVVLDQDFKLTHTPTSGNDTFKSFVSPSFFINDDYSNIEFAVTSNVVNNWVEATIVLVNENDNRTWEVTKGIEYYEGYEDGSSWSEGSQTAKIMLSNIPQGKYHLNIYPASGDTARDQIHIKATANASMWRNTLLTALLLCLYPAFCWFMMRRFERKRWDNSDYSPFVN